MKNLRAALFDNYESTLERAEFALRIVAATTLNERCDALLCFYRKAKAEIIAKPDAWGIDPYEVRWSEVFTPIEMAIWHEIRRAGLVFYPQLPVGAAFVDFGNPFHKIAIECDGKDYHLDKLKDKRRDEMLARRGWQVFRITGADCLTDGDEDNDETWPTPARKFVLDIAERMKLAVTA